MMTATGDAMATAAADMETAAAVGTGEAAAAGTPFWICLWCRVRCSDGVQDLTLFSKSFAATLQPLKPCLGRKWRLETLWGSCSSHQGPAGCFCMVALLSALSQKCFMHSVALGAHTLLTGWAVSCDVLCNVLCR